MTVPFLRRTPPSVSENGVDRLTVTFGVFVVGAAELWMMLDDQPLTTTTSFTVAATAVADPVFTQLIAPASAALSATCCSCARWA